MKKILVAACALSLVALLVAPYGVGLCGESFYISGYWENWKPAIHPNADKNSDPEYYATDLSNFNAVYYSFLTLSSSPNPETPPNQEWDGKSLYETMTMGDAIEVITKTDPEWKNEYNWQRVKIQAIIDACHAKGKKFIWAIGGWSDLTRTISDEQIPAFVEYCVNLLKVAGDGVDFDWEHLSDHADIGRQQRSVLGKVFPVLRKALDDNGMQDKLIGYTTRFNAFWDDQTRPAGAKEFPSEGEGLDVASALKEAGSSFADCVSWVNIMMYDVPPTDVGVQDTFTLDTYKMVLDSFETYMPRSLIVMGFEPGGQAAGGVWEGMAVDKEVIDYLHAGGYGGVMFWAVNQPAFPPSTEVTGRNAQDLAGYAAASFRSE